MSSTQIYQNLQESKLYEPVVGDDSSLQWLVQSISGEVLDLRLSAAGQLTISAALIISAPEMINISVFREIVELLAESGCALERAMPIGKRSMRFVIARQLPAKYVAALVDFEAELATVDMASAAVLAALNRVADAAQLRFVDLSMFASMDLTQFEIVELLHRRFFEFESWDEVCEAAASHLEDSAARDEVVRQLRAFEQFEKKNPHIRLAEVVQYVVVAAQEISVATMPGPLEIN